MRCEEAQERWLSGQDAEARAHAAGCEACTRFIADQAKLDALLAVDAPQAAGADFDGRFFARLESAKRAQGAASGTPAQDVSAATRPGWSRLAVVAGPALLAAAAWLLWLRPGDPAVQPGGAADLVTEERAALARPTDAEDLALAAELELLQDMGVVERLEELQDYETLAQLDDAELDALARGETAL